MSNTSNYAKELECIERIIDGAHKLTKGKNPTVTDVLRSYDEYINKNKISSTSAMAQNVYKTLLRAARKKGENWLQKVKNDSQFQPSESNVFKKNLVQTTLFSFANENDSSVANKSQSYKLTQELTELSDEDLPDHDTNYPPLRKSTDRLDGSVSLNMDHLKRSPLKSIEKENQDWSTELSQVYRNPHLKNESNRILRPLDEFKPLDYQSFKYRDQSPPIRESDGKDFSTRDSNKEATRISMKDELSVNKYMKTFETGNYDSSKFDDIAHFASEDLKRRRVITGAGYITNTTTERDKGLNNSSKIFIDDEEEIEDLLFKDKVKGPAQEKVLNNYFDALKINILRKKRVDGNVENLTKRFNDRQMRNILKAWKVQARAHKLKNREKNIAKSMHNRTLIIKHWEQWMNFHWRVQDFSRRTRSFLSTRTLGTVRPVFDAWKGLVLEHKTRKLNKYTAAFFAAKKMLKRGFYGWRNQIIRERESKIMSWDCLRKYKAGLLYKGFKGLRIFKEVRDAHDRKKFELMDRCSYFAKKRAFRILRSQVEELISINAMDRKVDAWNKVSLIQRFFKQLPSFTHQQKIFKKQLHKAASFFQGTAQRTFFNNWYSFCMRRREQDHYCQMWNFNKVGKKSIKGFKLNVARRAIPSFYSYGVCVWLLYELLTYSNAIKKQNSSISLSVKPASASRYSIYSRRVSQDSKLNDISFNEKLEEFPFMLPQYFNISSNKKYQIIHNESNRTLNNYLVGRIFQTWKKSFQAISAYKKKRTISMIFPYFKAWKNRANRKVINEYKVKSHEYKWNKPIFQKIFHTWAKFSMKKRTLRRLYKNTVTGKEETVVSQCFYRWNILSRNNITSRQQTTVAESFRGTKMVEKLFKFWVSYTAKQTRLRMKQHQFYKKRFERLLELGFNAWIKFLDIKYEKNKEYRRVREIYQENLTEKIFKHWKKYTKYRKSSLEILALIKIKKKRIQLSKIVRSWKKLTRKAKSENNLISKLHQHHSSLLTRKSFYSLLAYLHKKREQHHEDNLAIERVSYLPMKRVNLPLKILNNIL